jgi:predicted nucleotidyltransferase
MRPRGLGCGVIGQPALGKTSAGRRRSRDSPTGSPTRPPRRAVEALDPEPLLRFLDARGVEHILIGGVAVAAHGYRRPSTDLDIVPAGDPENLGRLADALAAIRARPAELGDFDAGEMPADATRVEDLVLGGNFRLETDLGSLDVMQWVSGVEADDLYAELDRQALEFWLDGVRVRYCGLAHLLAMKRAAGRPRDLDDLEHLPPE